MSATPKPIEWLDDRFSFEKGYVGGIEVFAVGPSTVGADYILGCNLPGTRSTRNISGGRKAAKAEAQRLLTEFVHAITA
jgi:hypothetical protein